jgi:hypothetical protein
MAHGKNRQNLEIEELNNKRNLSLLNLMPL